MNKERQVRYNCKRSKLNPNCNEWWFLIINQNRETSDIEQKIYSTFAPIIDETKTISGVVKGTGLRYKLIDFESSKSVKDIIFSSIYPNIARDRKLYGRGTSDGLENYLAEQFK